MPVSHIELIFSVRLSSVASCGNETFGFISRGKYVVRGRVLSSSNNE